MRFAGSVHSFLGAGDGKERAGATAALFPKPGCRSRGHN